MNFPHTRIWKDLMFLGGHIADPQLAVSLAAEPAPPSTAPHNRSTPMNFFKSLMYLGGLEDVDLRIHENTDEFGPTYGNRVAAEQAFGKASNAPARGNATTPSLGQNALGGCS